MDSTNPPPAALDAAPADQLPPVVFSELLGAADQVYLRDLPGLLKTHPGWWVAYFGPERIGLARTHMDIRKQLAAGPDYPWHEVLICCIEPEPEVEDFIGMQPMGEPR
jgi:hypothetical protein